MGTFECIQLNKYMYILKKLLNRILQFLRLADWSTAITKRQ